METTITTRIEKTSETYVRRLCQEISDNFQHRVYFKATRDGAAVSQRITDVRFSNGEFWIKAPSYKGWRIIKTTPENMDAFFAELKDGKIVKVS